MTRRVDETRLERALGADGVGGFDDRDGVRGRRFGPACLRKPLDAHRTLHGEETINVMLGNGTSIAIGIGLQNAPEGLAVAVALLGEGYSRKLSFMIAALSGMIEPVGGLLGVLAVTVSQQLLPWGLAFAAGAMIYVIVHEIIPEIHSRAFANEATAGLTSGLVVMMFLGVTLG